MPFIGLGLHLVIAVFFAIHAVRTHKDMYWLLILFSFPLLGSVVYLFAVYLPDSRLQHTVRKTAASAARALDPGRELREAREAFDLTPTAQNQMRLANALLAAGEAAQAAGHFEACLKGPFANDPEIRLGAARARFHEGQIASAIQLVESIRQETPDFRPEQISLLLAQAYGYAGRNEEARTEFATAVNRFGSLEAKVEFALWALRTGDRETANIQYRDIEGAMRHWNKHTRSLNKPLVRRLEQAFAETGKA